MKKQFTVVKQSDYSTLNIVGNIFKWIGILGLAISIALVTVSIIAWIRGNEEGKYCILGCFGFSFWSFICFFISEIIKAFRDIAINIYIIAHPIVVENITPVEDIISPIIVKKPNYRVYGVDRETGKEKIIEIEALNVEDATNYANINGLLVSKVEKF